MQQQRKTLCRVLLKPFLLALALILVSSCTVYAWFVAGRMSRTDTLEVDIPPIIYIKDDNLREMTSFQLDGLQIRQDYTAVFCVAPAYRNAVETFELGVIYTENIGMIIEIYPVTGIAAAAGAGKSVFRTLNEGGTEFPCYFGYDEALSPAVTGEQGALREKTTYGDWVNETPATDGSLNGGVYRLYSGFRFTESESAPTGSIYEKLRDTAAYRFFVLRVTWKEDISEAELEKETDIVYIVSKGTAKELS